MRFLFFVLFVVGFSSFVDSSPDYANEQTKNIIEKMLEAHGGYNNWESKNIIQFDAIMHNNYHGKNELAWWAATETIDKRTLQVHQNWFLDKASLGFDGEQVWSVNWRKANPPTAMLYFFYYFINLPFLTQQDSVQLSEATEFQWPGHGGKSYHEIKMTFSEKPVIGKSAIDYFVLYIDKRTYRLVGYQYAIGNRAFLDALGQPAERKLFGPLWRIITSYQTVDGIVFPATFRTMPEPDERIVGNHIIRNIRFIEDVASGFWEIPGAAIIDPPSRR
ncbi:hypothetical protein [Planctobacterium marinum]|uniref:Uncharacterized protein n=1 Tax=Planctobacterium marinum TaxID=1631968 RepID=A0AA48HG57_9ALTE|nr:hypothetical protein MACH26_18590 [Planctobacterium marinum]